MCKRLNVPRPVTEESILALLIEKAPPIDERETKGLDGQSRRATELRDFSTALYKKIMAALAYEQLGSDNKNITLATFCYDRAAKAAYELGFPMVEFRCALRAARLRNTLIKNGEDNLRTRSDLKYSRDWIKIAANEKMGCSPKYGNGHKWFR